MIGVEILATQEVVTVTVFNWSMFWAAIVICMGVSLVIGAIMSIAENDFAPFVGLCICGAIAGLVFGSIAGTAEGIPTEYETRYKVVISDQVSMNDFLERYEIVSQEGKIYTVRERDN